jgi:hypothetical protein
LSLEYDELDVLSETRSLSDQEKERVKQIYVGLSRLWEMEEIKARQRSRQRDVKERDMNTKYFQAVANQRRRKTTLHSLDGPDGTVKTIEEIVKIATNYYRELFKKEIKPDIDIESDFFSEGDKVIAEENAVLEADFTKEEV